MALSKTSVLRHAGGFDAIKVHVPEWADENGDDVVLVRGMTLREFEINAARAAEGEAAASLIARCALDDNGARLFSDDDVRVIAELPLKQALELSAAITEASGMTDPDPSKVVDSAIADAEGNSDATVNSDSSSASQSDSGAPSTN